MRVIGARGARGARGASSVYRRMFANIRGPVALIIQGAAIARVGLVVVIANLGSNTAPMQKERVCMIE